VGGQEDPVGVRVVFVEFAVAAPVDGGVELGVHVGVAEGPAEIGQDRFGADGAVVAAAQDPDDVAGQGASEAA
jgi:hypothetical protein